MSSSSFSRLRESELVTSLGVSVTAGPNITAPSGENQIENGSLMGLNAANGSGRSGSSSGGGDGSDLGAGMSVKERDQLNMQSSAFDALERDFREVLNELVGDKSLERFRLEYEKLHHTLKKSHENEKRLIKKCRGLNGEIVANAAKIQTALRLSLQDQNSIALLKKEIDKAWKMVDGAQEKEKRARETIQRLKGEIQNLSRLVDQGAGLSIGQENAVNELLKIKEELSNEVELQRQTIENNNRKISELETHVHEYEDKKKEMEKEKLILLDKTAKIKAEAQREARRAERLQQEMLGIKEVNDKRKIEIHEKQVKLDDLQEKNNDMENKMRAVTSHLDKYQSVADELKLKNSELEKSIQFHIHREGELIADKEASQNQVATISKNFKKKMNELTNALKKKDKVEKEKEHLLAAKNEAEKYRNWLKEEMKNVLKSLENQKRDAETDEKLIKELQQQIKRLNSSLHLSQEKNAMQFKLVEDHESVKASLEADILSHKIEEQRLRKRNYMLEKQREKAAMNAASWLSKFQESLETMKLKEMENHELTKNMLDEKNKLKQQQNLYEQVRSDRNLFSKQQVQAEDEIAEMKRKFKIMTHQIDQLKEEIQTKDAALINEHFAYKRLQDEMKVNKRKLAKRKEVLGKADAVLASQDQEIKNLRRTLNEAETASHAQKRVYDDVVQERDILGTQLIRRNDELALLYEKIRIQQSTLNKGELQYRERLLDIRRYKLDINNIKRQLQIRSHEVTNIEALKNEVYHVQRELLQERTKVKALSEELENPMNVHRWRKLEGQDPGRYELIQKIQTLQRRLIHKTEAVVEKDLLLAEKEKLYVELKNLLARQPGPEVAEQLSKYQHSLKEKTRQMKAMAAELNMLQAQVNEYRYEIDRTTRELQDTKRKFLEQRRKEQVRLDETRIASGAVQDPIAQQQAAFIATQPRITGGGFNLQAGSLTAGSMTVAH